jgi:hypothetical protein
MYRLLRLPIRRTSTANAFLRTYASQQTTPSLTEGERYIFDKLTKELEPSELLVQDVSGLHAVPFSAISFRAYQRVLWSLLSPRCVYRAVFRWLWFFLCNYHCEREAQGAPDPQAASENKRTFSKTTWLGYMDSRFVTRTHR